MTSPSDLSDSQKQIARQAAIDALMPRLLRVKDWQVDKRDSLKSRIALIKSHMGDGLPEVEAAMNAILAVKNGVGDG